MNLLRAGMLTLSLLLPAALSCGAQALRAEEPDAGKMQWFRDAKLGIFIHWGIYAGKGVSESWSFFNNYLNHQRYMEQLNDFTAARYEPSVWAKLIKDSGAKYAVITAKHHDGVALWDSRQAKSITIPRRAAAGRDVLSPFVAELKRTGLKTGIYFSLPDWSYPDYDVFTRLQQRYDIKKDPRRFAVFQKYMLGQLEELSQQFRPDVLWFDGDWEHNAEEWQATKILSTLRSYSPGIIVNSRLNGRGDYDTPEQGIPVLAPQNPYWELNYTMNDSWGYQPTDQNYKSANMIIRTLVDCLSMGGNLLLDIGPKADGSIPEQQVQILESLGRWTKKHAEAIYGTRTGLAAGHFSGKSARSANGRKLFLYLEENRRNLLLRGIATDPEEVDVLGAGGGKAAWVREGADLRIDLDEDAFDPDVTVVMISFPEAARILEPIPPRTDLDGFFARGEEPVAIRLENMAHQLGAGTNPFLGSDLPADGMNYRPQQALVDPDLLRWTIKHAEALYKTGRGLPPGHFNGASALSADRQTIYLFVPGKPTGPVALKGIKNAIARVRVVGDGRMIAHTTFNKLYWSEVPGINYIGIPDYALDQNMTVIAVLLHGPLELYRERVGAIENNF